MGKLLFIFERDMPTVSITKDMFLRLAEKHSICSDFMHLVDVRPSDIDNHDIIFFIRPNNTYACKIAERARKCGHTTVTFCDDDLLNLSGSAPNIPWRRRGLLRVLSSSDIILSSSRYIAEKYRPFTAGKRMALIDTIVWDEELTCSYCEEKEENIVKIVYAAAPSHAELFDKLIKPIIPQLQEKYREKISLTFVSVHPEVNGANCTFVRGMPLKEYREYMKNSHFDIGLAPLSTDEFSKCKYYNKFIEYTIQGIVGIYSNTEPYLFTVQDQVNGVLADNTTEAWLDKLSLLIDDVALRKACLSNAIKFLREHHSEEACWKRLKKGIPEIDAVGSGYKKCNSFRLDNLQYRCMRMIERIYLLGYYFKHSGCSGVYKKVVEHKLAVKAYR